MKMGYVLGAVVLVSGGVALYSGSSFRESKPAPEPPAPLPAAAAVANPDPAGSADTLIEGKVLETLDVPGYTYIRIGAAGSEGQWTAVATAQVKVGDAVRVRSQTTMRDFESSTLKRKFATIHFGTLDDGKMAAGAGALPPGHPAAGAAPGASGQPAPGADLPAHPSAMGAAAPVEIGKVEKATGPDGRTVAEVFAQKKELAGKKVRVRGVVVKSMSGIMGKNFLHLRDGSGTDQAKNNDLTVTTAEEFQKSQTVMLEGTLVLDKDLGAGYRYDALLEDAKTVR